MKRNKKYLLGLVILVFVVVVFIFSRTYSEHNRYVNTTYGFSVSYPKDWKEVEGTGLGGEVVTLTKNDNNKSIYFAYSNSLAETSLVAPIDKRQNLRMALGYEMVNIEEIAIGGVKGYKGDFYNDSINYHGKVYYIEHSGHIFSLGYDQSLEKDIEVNKIIQSFTFLR